jgi:choline dehydrogenase-like flavoprotein
MGSDPGNSVADTWGRAHDHPNLFIAGSSLFPSGGTVNPTLTIAALSLRTADAISRELGGVVR